MGIVGKLRQIGADFAEDGLNAEDLKTGNAREIHAKNPFQMTG